MTELLLNPVDTLKEYGMSIETIARIAQVRGADLRRTNWEKVPSEDPTAARLNNAASLLDALDKSTQPVDAAAFYEEHIVILKKDGKPFYCRAFDLYEAGLWSQDDFTDYADTAIFYDMSDFMEEFPMTMRVVTSSDGYGSIVCQRPIASVDFASVPDPEAFTVVK